MITPTQRGAIAETVIVAEATKLGIAVYRPVSEGGRADMIFDVHGRLLRVQCKSARLNRDVLEVRAITCRRTADGYARCTYSPDDVDLIAAYCAALDTCLAIPIGDFPRGGWLSLRLAATRNNQEVGVQWAKQYELGAIAQLGERSAGSRKVVGSSPTSSTGTSRSSGRLFYFPARCLAPAPMPGLGSRRG